MVHRAAERRAHCLELLKAGIAAADPATAVTKHLLNRAGRFCLGLNADNSQTRSGDWHRIRVIAFGKAACAMAEATRSTIPSDLLTVPGLIVTTYENARPIEGFEVLAAGHPLPDENGLRAAEIMASSVQQAQKNELVLALISGGGSALLPCPVDGLCLADKITTTQLLLNSGASIHQLNCVRKHLSRLKGGGLAKLSAPADLHAMILSDVLDDDLSVIASGPTVADDTTFAEAIEILQTRQLWNQTPVRVREHLEQGRRGLRDETLKSDAALLDHVSHTLIGSNALSVAAAMKAAQTLGYEAELYHSSLCGEAREVASQLAVNCKQRYHAGLQQPVALIAGGETTVTVTGQGKGGRNQEMTLAFALAMEKLGLKQHWTFLSAGTDGRDGPTDAAGGLVDGQTLTHMRAAGIAPEAALADNDAYTALKASNDLVITGATSTNVADLQILLLHPITE